MPKLKLAVFASGEGSTMQHVIDAHKSERLKAEIKIVISNNSKSMALKRAEKEGIPFRHLSEKTEGSFEALDETLLKLLREYDVNTILLLGYMRRLGPKVIAHFRGRILNTHPALLPKFGGQGMYGMHVHEAVIKAGEKESGATIHFVDEEYDHGDMVGQCVVPVLEGDTAETLAERVREREKEFLVEILRGIEMGEIGIRGME